VPATAATLSGLVLVAIIGWYGWQRYTQVPHDKQSGCPLSGPIAVHAILVDRSDPLTPVQSERLHQLVEDVAVHAAVDERVDLYVLTSGGGAAATPVLSLCRPPSEGNRLTENPERLRRAFAQRFLNPLESAVNEFSQPTETPDSPIMESVKAVCVTAFGGLNSKVRTQLSIASDMIENSPVLNQYRPYDVESFFRSPKVALVLADCHGANVDILYFTRPRDARYQTRMHELFWERFLDRMNARLMSMERI
jgi:hypothetical protein